MDLELYFKLLGTGESSEASRSHYLCLYQYTLGWETVPGSWNVQMYLQ